MSPFQLSAAPARDVAGIHVKSLEDLFARARQLLHRIHDPHLIGYAQAPEERSVGPLVNAGLVPAKVNRNPVRDFMVQCSEDPLARSHGFLHGFCSRCVCRFFAPQLNPGAGIWQAAP